MKGCSLAKRIGAAAIALSALTASATAIAERVNTDSVVNVITAFRTLDALSWDTQRWPWKANHDHLGAEMLMRGDLTYGPRDRDLFSFGYPDHIPDFAVTGALAESWEEHPDRLVFNLREGVEWWEIPGVMERRPLTASDVVNHFETMKGTARYIPGYWDYVERFEARDEDHQVVVHLTNFHGNWPYRMGWGFWSGIMPPEWHALDARARSDWENAPGTGPYRIAEVHRGRAQNYIANPHYWDTEIIDGEEYRLPLNAGVNYHIIRDESAAIAAFTSGHVDILEGIRWQFIDQVRRAAPHIRTREGVVPSGTYIALRNDRPPFDDVRVRRAMNLAIDQRQILDSILDGRGELLNYPLGPGFIGYHEPIDDLPPAAQELFEYNPDKARELLAEAGYEDGFEFELMASASNPYHHDLLAMLEAYYMRIGVTMNINQLDYPVFVSQMRADSMAPGYLMDNSSGNPIAAMRKTFQCGQHWNASMHCDEEYDRRMMEAKREPDEAKRTELVQALNRYIMTERVPHVWLPSGVAYIGWWPWVKNYAGETRIGAMAPNAVYARIWIDEDERSRILGQ